MEISEISKDYHVRKMTKEDIDNIYNLSKANLLFYKYCPPFITKEIIMEDLIALPPNVSISNKYYIGYFKNENLIAIMDLILGYPNDHTAFIGLFLISENEQGKGIGTKIISECVHFLKMENYDYVRLAYAKGNPQSSFFWKKNQFFETGEVSKKEYYTAILMQRKI